jgi:hypothetical protein
VQHYVDAAIDNKTLTKKEEGGKDTYYKDGKKFDLDDPKSMKALIEIVKKEDFKDARNDPKETLELCEKLSRDRANRVHASLLKYAVNAKLILDRNQIQPEGVSILEPEVVNPKDDDEKAKNRRVEIRISGVQGQLVVPTDKIVYDY